MSETGKVENFCSVCFGAFTRNVPGVPPNRVKSQTCDANHFFHVDCARDLNPYEICPGCATACRYCTEHVEEDERIALCDEKRNHHVYHGHCLEVNKRKISDSCPECAKELLESHKTGPCAVCGEVLPLRYWEFDCDHGMHRHCFKPWDDDLVSGCVACGTAQAFCPLCKTLAGPNHGHELRKCPNSDCGALLFELAMKNHHCVVGTLFGQKPCFACGKAMEDHETSCAKALDRKMKMRNGRPRFACPICGHLCDSLQKHFADAHRPAECGRCMFVVSRHVLKKHESKCKGSQRCPANGCGQTVSMAVRNAGIVDAQKLVDDHDCRELFGCPNCERSFISVEKMNVHAFDCANENRNATTNKRPRRQAFSDGLEVISAIRNIQHRSPIRPREFRIENENEEEFDLDI